MVSPNFNLRGRSFKIKHVLTSQQTLHYDFGPLNEITNSVLENVLAMGKVLQLKNSCGWSARIKSEFRKKNGKNVKSMMHPYEVGCASIGIG